MVVKFIDGEPPRRRNAVSIEEDLAFDVQQELRQHPGVWAIIEDGVSAGRVGAWKDILGPQYEVSQRQNGKREQISGKPLFTCFARRKPLHEDTRSEPPPPRKRSR